jgi:amidophosphoribosyltransferase
MSLKSLVTDQVQQTTDGLKSSWREECGVFGIWNHPQAAELTYLGLYAMQHRGQESAGIATSDGEKLHVHKGLGLVSEVFDQFPWSTLPGKSAIGHVRYSTTGENLAVNAQPLKADVRGKPIALAHNGNVVNSHELRENLQKQGALFQGTSDSEIFLHLLSRIGGENWSQTLPQALEWVQGAYSMTWLGVDRLVGMRDPMGFRPLVIGKFSSSSYVLASETCALDLVGAQFVRDVEPGEMVVIDDRGLTSYQFKKSSKKAACIFELIYFSRSDSQTFGHHVYEARKKFGEQLAVESPVEADMVVPVPDSGVAAAIGYAKKSGIPFEWGIVRNGYVGRTFIQPAQGMRDFGVQIKLNPQRALLKDKKIVVIDDSLVRGTTSKKIIQILREAGAKEVHLRIASPATISPCFYGVDTPQKSQLIAAQKSVDEIRKFIGADSLAYLTLGGLFKSLAEPEESFCAACFNEKYPTRVNT